MNKPHDRNFGLDLARSIAICSVLISHFSKQMEPFGFWGVELFFALSGYLIGNILWRSFSSAEKWGPANIFNFWSRRWWRTLPNYYLFLAVTVIGVYFSYQYAVPSSDVATTLWFGQYIVKQPVDFYGVSWSLCIEEWFYLLFPLVLYIFSKVIKKKQAAFATVILFFLIVSATMRVIVAVNWPNGFPIRKLTFCRLDAIAFGVGIAFCSAIFNITHRIRRMAFFAGLACLLPAFIMVHLLGINYLAAAPIQFFAVVAPLGFALVLPVTGQMQRPGPRFTFVDACINKISLWSYSIYLSHLPILFTLYNIIVASRASFFINFICKITALAVTVLISALLYKYFELPLTRKRPAELKAKKLYM